MKVDEEGKLRWHKNGMYVDTTVGRWKDGGPDVGIVAKQNEDEEQDPKRSVSPQRSIDSRDEDAVMHYTGYKSTKKSRLARFYKRNFTLHGITDRILRKTLRRNTWMYVSVSTVSTLALLVL